MKRILSRIIFQALILLFITSAAYADFTLQLASYPYKSNAERHIKSLKAQNYDAFIHVQERDYSDGDFWYKVRLGPFPTRKAALDKKQAMLDNGFEGEILVVESPTENIDRNATVDKNDNESTVHEIEKYLETLPPSTARIQAKADIDSEMNPTSSQPPKKGAKEITLEWDANTEPDLAGYKVYYDTDPNPPYNPDKTDYAEEGPPPIRVGKDITRITLHGLTGNKDYYFSITAINTSGLESDESNKARTKPSVAFPKKPDTTDKPIEKKVSKIAKKEDIPGTAKLPSTPIKPEPAVLSEDDTQFERPQPTYKPSFSPEDAPDTTILSAGDTLFIEFPGQKQMSQNYDIGPDGNLYIMALGKIKAHGLAIADLHRVLSKKGRRYISKGEQPVIQLIDIKRYVHIRGGVRYAGWYRVSPWSKVDDLIDMAGGLLSPEGYSKIRLLRPTKEGMLQIDLKGEIMLESNDILDIPFPKEYRKKIDGGDLLFISIPRKAARVYEGGYATESIDFKRELQQNQIEVDRNGYLYIPSLGHLYVRNLTTQEIEKIIESRLPKYLARAEKVIVSIVEKKHFVQVYGHVHKPGRLNIQETGTVQEALSAAGNAIDGAIMSNIEIHRRRANRLHRIKVNMYQYTITGDERLLTPLQENDTLFVPISSNFGNVKRTLDAWEPPTERLEEDVKAKVRIFGAVHNVGIYEPREDMDLIDLLILASGQTDDADLSKVLIIRNNRIELSFNMEEWLEKFAEQEFNPVPKLRNGDTVFVTYVKKKEHEPKEDELFYVLGEVGDQGQNKLWDRMTVLQALALAGGLNDFADSEHIMIIRWVEGRQENIPFNFIKAVQGKLPESNIYVQARDVIYVP